MDVWSMLSKNPEIRVYAGPNGSGKSTIASDEDIILPYINADDIQKSRNISNIEAAQIATAMRDLAVDQKISFTFETVLSTDRNLLLLERAKKSGYFIRCAFILTYDPSINILRVKDRVANGGHDVPNDKIVSRYYKAISMIPRLMKVCDRLNIYDNTTDTPVRIFKKRNESYEIFDNQIWTHEEIVNLIQFGHK